MTSFTSTSASNNILNNGVPPPRLDPPQPIHVQPVRYYMPLFTNNSQVFYKPNSLPSCGVGSVRNSRLKARRT